MTRIVFIGAGSVVFTRQLATDLLRFDDLDPFELVLHDVDPDRLAVAAGTATQLAAQFGKPMTVRAEANRRKALDGADFVVNTIQVGGIDGTYKDLRIPATYGLLQTIGDTTGVGGVFRGLRTFPVLSQIAADMAAVCPDAWLLNYTNPMAMNIWWLSVAAPAIKSVGLCHSVFWTVHGLCELIGVPVGEVTYRAAGVNHQAWLYQWERDGQSLYPKLDAVIEADPEMKRRVRVEMYRRIGYYPTETSEHSSEYLSWFLRSKEQIEQFRIEPLQYIGISEENVAEYVAAKKAMDEGGPLPPHEDEGAAEYAPQVIHSMCTGTVREIHANVPNASLIDNLHQGACVEVPARVDASGITPIAVGSIPAQGAIHNRTYLSVAELAIKATLDGNRDLVKQALLCDPNASSTLTPDQIWAMCDELFEAHLPNLPESLGGAVPLVLP